jgi:glutamate 5-kinase
MRAKLEAAEAVAAAGVEVAVVGFRGGAALAEALSLAELRSGGTRIAAAERA